jgi:subfamily B ATP-binding cassette protein MsbA
MLLTYIAMAFFANFQFAVLVAIGAGISNLFYKRIYTSTKKASIGVAKKGDEFSKYLTQAIHYFKYLKATNNFNKFSFHLRRVIQGSEHLYRKMGFSSAITTSFKEPMIIIIVSGVIYLQMNFMGTGIATILLSLLFFYRALSFLLMVQNSWQNFIQNAGAISSVSELINSMSDMQEPLVTNNFKGLNSQLHLKNIEFSYGDTKVLSNADLLIPKNKTVAIIGESGSGKTTLANMVAGLIDPSSGAVLLDNVPLTDYNKDSFRSRIGYISQEAVIFNDSVFNNITFWAEQSEENLDKFWKVIALASLTEFVRMQPGNENALLGDNGIMVSGGQKQRISIARELYKDVELLILDEATSALDSETERVIQDNIDKLHGTYTMIIIAHRLSTIKNADIIYLLEKGTVSASGSFEQMLERSDRFKKMVSLQEIG